MRVVATALFLLFLSGSTAYAMQHEATPDKGKALFNDPKLGTTATRTEPDRSGPGSGRTWRRS